MQKGKITRLESRIQELEKQVTKKEIEYQQFTENFVANISHEIRTPLNGIVGFSSLINSGQITDRKREQFLRHIGDSTERLVRMVDNLIELSYLQAGNMRLNVEKSSISEILKSAFYYANHLKLKYKKPSIVIISNETLYEDDKEEILVDYSRLLLVLKNMLNNSVKHTNEGIIEFGCLIKGKSLEFFVKDTGEGILDPDNKIFEAFHKTEEHHLTSSNGLGIGLSVCKGIITKMGGKIWFKTNNPGTSFYFTVPYIRNNTAVGKKKKNAQVYVS